MVDEKKEIEQKPDNTPEDSGDGDKYETTPVIERARQENERMEKATEAQRIENDRAEAIMAKRALGGTSEAGQEPVKKSDDEKWAEGAKERYAGTGMDPTPDKTPTTYG